jgi:broad specificity phosphatase PhoE
MTFLKLLLVRHGQSVGNAAGRMEGCQSTGLTALGRCQALRLGQRLAVEGWQPTHIYCSPLRRASETLAMMTAGFEPQLPNMPVSLERVPVFWREDLKEYDNGILKGLTWEEAKGRYPELCSSLEQSLDWLPIPEAETLQQGHHRAQQFVTHLLQQHQTGDRIWVISHHWILQQIVARLMGCDRTWGFALGHTALVELWLDQNRWYQPDPNRWNSELWQLKRFNDNQHCVLAEQPCPGRELEG